jgi:hypothetical protein
MSDDGIAIHVFTGNHDMWMFDYLEREMNAVIHRKPVVMGTELEFVIMVIAVSCVKLLSAHNSTQHTSRKHKV